MICKKCNVNMEIRKQKDERRGHDATDDSTEYYCPKCDHLEYGD